MDALDWELVGTWVTLRTSLCWDRLIVDSVVRRGRIYEVLHSTSGGRTVFLLLFGGLCELSGGARGGMESSRGVKTDRGVMSLDSWEET